MYDQAQLMLCHCIGGVIPGCGVIFDNSSDGYSCKHAAVCWKYYALYNKLVHSLSEWINPAKTCTSSHNCADNSGSDSECSCACV